MGSKICTTKETDKHEMVKQDTDFQVVNAPKSQFENQSNIDEDLSITNFPRKSQIKSPSIKMKDRHDEQKIQRRIQRMMLINELNVGNQIVYQGELCRYKPSSKPNFISR